MRPIDTFLAGLIITLGILMPVSAVYHLPATDVNGTLDLKSNPIINASNITTLEGNDTVHDTDIAANATKADNALAWLALNETAIGVVETDLGANETRIIALEGHVSHLNVIAGGSAGNHTLTGVAVGDELSGVLYAATADGKVSTITDLSSEFTILDDDVVENAGHTDTTSGYLIIGWIDKT